MRQFLTLAITALTLLAVAPAASAYEYASFDAKLACPTGYEKWEINLPLAGSERYSQFYLRLNKGPWQSSRLYYTTPWVQYVQREDGKWYFVPYGSTPLSAVIGDNVLVEAWEYRYVNGWTWIDLGSCRTSSLAGGGIVFGNG